MATAICSTSASADPREPRRPIDIRAATLPEALAELSRETDASFGTQGGLPRLRTPSVHGRLTIAEALDRLLVKSGYWARRVGPSAWRIERRPTSAPPRTAPTAPTAVTEDLAAIIVTGGKRREPLADLPMALSVVRLPAGDAIDPAMGTSWLGGEVEGVALTNLGPGRNRLFLRGVADSPFNGDSQSTVAVILDDVRLTYAAPDPDIRLIDVDRVEVLKGPQGALYGTGALGGIYHIVTRRAALYETSVTAAFGGEAVASGGVGYSASGVVNVPILPDRAALRLVGYSAREPGWVDTGGRSNTNASQVLGTRAELGIDAGDDWRLDVTAFGQWLNSRDSQYVYSPGARHRPAQFLEPHDNDLRHLSLRLGKRSGNVEMVLSSGLSWHEVGDTLDATIGAEGLGVANPTVLTDDRQYRVWDSEARISGQSGAVHWLAGLSHVAAKQTRVRSLLAVAPPAPLTIDAEQQKSSDTAAFGDIGVALTATLKFDVGARLFHSAVSQSGGVPAQTTVDERRRNGVTPSASLAWSPRTGQLIFLRYGGAFRQGAIGSGTNGSTALLKDDELATIEAGWREQLTGGGQLDVGAYFSWWENLQSDVLGPVGLIETQNAGNAHIFGIEASIDAPVARGWRLQGGATLVRARLVSNALGLALDDLRLPVVPDFTLRGAIRHDFSVGGAAVFVRVQLRYLGAARLSFDPAIDRPMGKVLESHLEGHIELKDFSINAKIENPLNLSANTFAFGNYLRFSKSREFNPQRPLNFLIMISKTF